jgi:hypothetical protein
MIISPTDFKFFLPLEREVLDKLSNALTIKRKYIVRLKSSETRKDSNIKPQLKLKFSNISEIMIQMTQPTLLGSKNMLCLGSICALDLSYLA